MAKKKKQNSPFQTELDLETGDVKISSPQVTTNKECFDATISIGNTDGYWECQPSRLGTNKSGENLGHCHSDREDKGFPIDAFNK
ncbi:MAG TPA: hypothetical protein V6D33_09100 [Cyanophyceae cyanobacterium]